MFSCTQKAWVNYERHLSDIKKFQHWEKFTIIYQQLDATVYFSLCDTETHVHRVGGFCIEHQIHTTLPVIGFSRIQDWALQVTKRLKARDKNCSKWYLNTMITETPVSDNLTFGITLWWGNRLEHDQVECSLCSTLSSIDSILYLFSPSTFTEAFHS